MRGRIGLGVICVVAGGWLVLAPGCGPCEDSPVITDGDSGSGPPAAVVYDIPVNYGQTHWIAIDDARMCENISGPSGEYWQGRSLFYTPLFSAVKRVPYPKPATLGCYCRYIWSGNGAPPQADIDALQAKFGAANLVLDQPAVVPQGTFESWASANFLNGVNWGTINQPGSPVSLAVIDNKSNRLSDWDTQIYGDGDNFHGDTLSTLIQEGVNRGGARRNVAVRNYMAMPWRRLGTSEVKVNTAGDYGYYGDLIDATHRPVHAWSRSLLHSDDFVADKISLRLVVNLSLGFEHEEGSCQVGDDNCLSAEKVVYDAIREASCHGAGIVAAAGNDTGGLNPTRALILPGGWQEHAAPTDEKCKELLGAEYWHAITMKFPGTLRPPSTTGKDGYLLHAVGAVDHQGQALRTARPGACPRYVALGLGWITDNAPEGASVLSGSSTSTAVVSTKAAVAWSLDTSKHFYDVLEGLDGPMKPFHPKGACGGGATCGELKWIGGQTSTISTQNPLDGWCPPTTVIPSPPATNCAPQPDTVIPLCVRPATLPFAEVFPQPNEIPCGKNCNVALTPGQPSTLYVEPANDWLEAMLVVEHNGSTRTYGLGTLPGGEGIFEIPLPDSIPENARVWISAYDNSGNRTRSQPILIARRPE